MQQAQRTSLVCTCLSLCVCLTSVKDMLVHPWAHRSCSRAANSALISNSSSTSSMSDDAWGARCGRAAHRAGVPWPKLRPSVDIVSSRQPCSSILRSLSNVCGHITCIKIQVKKQHTKMQDGLSCLRACVYVRASRRVCIVLMDAAYSPGRQALVVRHPGPSLTHQPPVAR